MKNKITLIFIIFATATTAKADTFTTRPTNVPDVVQQGLYKCIDSDGKMTYNFSGIPDKTDQVCSLERSFSIPNSKRIGLENYIVLDLEADRAQLMNTKSFRIQGIIREAWIMTSFAKIQGEGGLSKPWSRLVAKWTVNCQENTFIFGRGTLYSVGENSTEAVDYTNGDLVPEEPIPNSNGEVIVNYICNYKQSTENPYLDMANSHPEQ